MGTTLEPDPLLAPALAPPRPVGPAALHRRPGRTRQVGVPVSASVSALAFEIISPIILSCFCASVSLKSPAGGGPRGVSHCTSASTISRSTGHLAESIAQDGLTHAVETRGPLPTAFTFSEIPFHHRWAAASPLRGHRRRRHRAAAAAAASMWPSGLAHPCPAVSPLIFFKK